MRPGFARALSLMALGLTLPVGREEDAGPAPPSPDPRGGAAPEPPTRPTPVPRRGPSLDELTSALGGRVRCAAEDAPPTDLRRAPPPPPLPYERLVDRWQAGAAANPAKKRARKAQRQARRRSRGRR